MTTYEHVAPQYRHVLGLSDRERLAFVDREVLLPYPAAEEIRKRLLRLLVMPKRTRMGNLLIVSKSNNGKTGIIKRFQEEYGQPFANDDNKPVKPVIVAEAPPSADEKALYLSILEEFKAPYRLTAPAVQLGYQVLHLLRQCSTRMLIIDELHSLLAGSARRQSEVMNAIKRLCNQLQIELMRAMADAVAAAGLPFVWAIHAGRPVAPGEPRNRHWHLVFLERINDRIRRLPERWFRRANRKDPAAGGAPKERSLKGHEWLPNVRRRYEELVNGALERAGRTERVTAASHRDRIARAEAIGDHETAEQLRRHPPGLHIGPTASAIERGRPGRNEQPTIRGDLARARDARAAHLRADLEHIDGEMKEHLRATVAAARDAGVDEELVTAADANDPVSVVALVDATEIRRHEIRDAALRLGFDDDLIADIRATTEPDDADLGWTAVVESTEVYGEQVERSREIGLSVDGNSFMADARRRGTNPVPSLARLNDLWAKARSEGLGNQRLHDIYRGAEDRRAGTGSMAIEDATAEHVQRKSAAEVAARGAFVDVDAVYRRAREGDADELRALENQTAKAEPVVAAAREAGLDDAAIGRILRAAESRDGSRWSALKLAMAGRVERKSAAEAAARRLGLDVGFAYANAGADVDPVDHLEQVTAVWGRARGVGLDNAELNDIYRGAQNSQAGTGWMAIEDATAERVQRISAAEAAARSVFVDVDAVYRRAREGHADELEALEDECAEAEPVVAAAREAGVDDAEIGRILREADSTEDGSGWAALTRATAKRVERKSAAEAAARQLGLHVEVIYANVGDEDPVDHLERVTAVWGRRDVPGSTTRS